MDPIYGSVCVPLPSQPKEAWMVGWMDVKEKKELATAIALNRRDFRPIKYWEIIQIPNLLKSPMQGEDQVAICLNFLLSKVLSLLIEKRDKN